MSQYYRVFNLDKKETLDPGRFGQGMNLGGIANDDKPWLLMGLTYLLALGGSGLHREDPLFGRWAGDRVAIVGDYHAGMHGGLEWNMDLWARRGAWQDGWVDISEHVIDSISRFFKVQVDPEGRADTTPRSALHQDGTVRPLPNLEWSDEDIRDGRPGSGNP